MSLLWALPLVVLVGTAAALVVTARRIEQEHARLAASIDALEQTRAEVHDAVAVLDAARARPGRSGPDVHR